MNLPLTRPLDPLPQGDSSGSGPRQGLAVAGRSDAARALLHPVRRRLLSALQAPGSASSVAEGLGLSRQRVNYHVRALERAGLIEEIGRRGRRGLEERIVRATASSYVISPSAGALASDAHFSPEDRFSAGYQVAVASRTIREVAALSTLAQQAGRKLSTMTLDTEVRFASSAARAAFAHDLFRSVTELVARYDAEPSPETRAYRMFVGVHPTYVEPPAAPPAGRKRPRRSPERRPA